MLQCAGQHFINRNNLTYPSVLRCFFFVCVFFFFTAIVSFCCQPVVSFCVLGPQLACHLGIWMLSVLALQICHILCYSTFALRFVTLHSCRQILASLICLFRLLLLLIYLVQSVTKPCSLTDSHQSLRDINRPHA